MSGRAPTKVQNSNFAQQHNTHMQVLWFQNVTRAKSIISFLHNRTLTHTRSERPWLRKPRKCIHLMEHTLACAHGAVCLRQFSSRRAQRAFVLTLALCGQRFLFCISCVYRGEHSRRKRWGRRVSSCAPWGPAGPHLRRRSPIQQKDLPFCDPNLPQRHIYPL
jgi:hypothetical protein